MWWVIIHCKYYVSWDITSRKLSGCRWTSIRKKVYIVNFQYLYISVRDRNIHLKNKSVFLTIYIRAKNAKHLSQGSWNIFVKKRLINISNLYSIFYACFLNLIARFFSRQGKKVWLLLRHRWTLRQKVMRKQ